MEPQPLPPPTPIQSEHVAQPHSHKRLSILLVILVFLFLITIGVFAYQAYQTSQTTKTIPPADPDIRPTSSQTPDETAEWKTYRNERFSFELEYPQTWEIVEDTPISPEIIILSPDNSSNLIIALSHEARYTTDRNRNEKLAKGSTILFSGHSAREYREELEDEYLRDIQLEEYWTKPNEISYLVDKSQANYTKTIETFDQILSTFRFLEEEEQKLTKECKNETLKVSLQIPTDWICQSEASSNIKSWMEIQSGEVSIIISNLGRGGPCGAGPERENCKYALFFRNDVVTLNNYFDSNVADYEIYGEITVDTKPWISIRPRDKTKKAPTKEEEESLKEVFNTLQILP